jgi:hypothetical protein
VRWLLCSVVLHAIALVCLMPERDAAAPTASHAHVEGTPEVPERDTAASMASHAHVEGTSAPTPIVVEIVSATAGGGSGVPGARDAGRPRRARPARSTASHDAWEGLAIGEDRQGAGHGVGDGAGAGTGRGIGFGDGGIVSQAVRDIPPPPVPAEAPPSKARPAKLVWPTRDEKVADDADLFVARVAVDEDGAVVGARMIKTRPGARGDDAANAIWRFRYLPALDDRGTPIRSTFEQPFQVR